MFATFWEFTSLFGRDYFGEPHPWHIMSHAGHLVDQRGYIVTVQINEQVMTFIFRYPRFIKLSPIISFVILLITPPRKLCVGPLMASKHSFDTRFCRWSDRFSVHVIWPGDVILWCKHISLSGTWLIFVYDLVYSNTVFKILLGLWALTT